MIAAKPNASVDKEWTRAMASLEIMGYGFWEAERMARGPQGFALLGRPFPEPPRPCSVFRPLSYYR